MFRVWKILLSLVILISGGGCNSPSEKPLRLGMILWPGYELLYLAKHENYTDSSTVRLIQLSSATEVMRAFRQGQLDVAALTLDEVIRLAQTEADLRIFLITNISNGADKVISRYPIDGLEQLEGKRMALEISAVGAMMLMEVLHAADLTRDQLTLIPSTVDQHIGIMRQAEVDAVISFEPYASALVSEGYHVIFDSSKLQNPIIDVLVSRESIIEQHQQQFQQLLAGHWQAVELLKQHPEKALPILKQRLGQTETALTGIYQGLIIPDFDHNARIIEHELNGLAASTREAMFEFGLLNETPMLDALADNTLHENSR